MKFVSVVARLFVAFLACGCITTEDYAFQGGLCAAKGKAAQSDNVAGGVFYTFVEVSGCYSPGFQYYIPTSDAQSYPGTPRAYPFNPNRWEVKSPDNGKYYPLN